VGFQMVAWASAGARSSAFGDEEWATRRRFILVTETLGVRETGWGADACFTGDELSRRFEVPGNEVPMTDAEVVRRRRGSGRRGGFSLKGEIGWTGLFFKIELGVIDRRHFRSDGRMESFTGRSLPNDECMLTGRASIASTNCQQTSLASASETCG